MTKILIELAKSFNQLPVEVNKITGTHLLWRDQSATSNSYMSDNEFVDNYSWVVKNSFFTDGSRKQSDITQTVFAERYGGFGIGINGGGARVVNINDAQVKGVGANALAGEGALRSHSYGGLDIQGAVKEIIYSRLLSKISPVGVQAISGLIFLDHTSALHNDNAAPSVLMVREPITRPGHFLPCINFRLKPEYQTLVRSDYSRVLGIYKGIGKQALLSDFYALIQNFLDKCADQLSFFRIARLSHNALSPSNISLDGRVLDTALCSFVVSGSNYGQVTSYFEEVSTPALITKEWFYLVSKFLGDEPVEEHFLKLYEEKFYQYASVNMGFIFGLDREMSTKLSSTLEWQKVASRTLSLLSMGSPTKTSTLPTVDAVDFFNDILSASLYALLNNSGINQKNKFLTEFTQDLRSLITLMAPALGWHGQNERSFYITFAIQIIKRAFLSSYFFITYIGRTVDDYYATGSVDKTAEIINENERVINWVYENLLNESCTIYSGNGVEIKYSNATDEYIYNDKNKIEKRFTDICALSAMIKTNQSAYIVQNYDFYPYLKRLFALIDNDPMNSFNGVKNVFC
ncbi:hypothetical protein [Paraglaciecola sp. L3A3]|uniref:hypothetical protein n=1 Tax=Paraglaciecola sp. L3A3 TaxID=2686358 RepID=UPI00131BB6C6|nr:hypothetical protein [Paraglaciecola sp. L3A3]